MFFPLMHRKFLSSSSKRMSAGENLFVSFRQKFNIKSSNTCRDLLFFCPDALFLKIERTGVCSFLHHSVHLLHFFASIPASFAGSGFIAALSFFPDAGRIPPFSNLPLVSFVRLCYADNS